MPRMDIADAPDGWNTVGGRYIAALPDDVHGAIYSPALGEWRGDYSIPVWVLDPKNKLNSVDLVTLNATSFLWWAYMIFGAFDDWPMAMVWDEVREQARRPPPHGSKHKTYECCLWCRHDITMRRVAAYLAATSPSRPMFHFTLQSPVDRPVKELLGRSLATLLTYEVHRSSSGHRDHPAAALLTPSRSRGSSCEPADYLHVHVVADAAAITVKQLHASARNNGLVVTGELVAPVADLLHVRFRVLAYAVRQVLVDDPSLDGWNQTRLPLWNARNAPPVPARREPATAPTPLPPYGGRAPTEVEVPLPEPAAWFL